MCLDAISSQDYPEESREIIVVDNGSKDTSAQIAFQLGARVLVDDSLHVSGLRNLGAKESIGDILVFVDSDCVLDEKWTRTAVGALAQEDVAMVGSKTHKLPATAGWIEKTWKLHLDASAEEKEPSWLVTRALAVKKKVFFEVGGFDEDLITCEDVAFGHAVSKRHKIKNLVELSPTHLEDPSTLQTFFFKEVWRGLGSTLTSLEYFRSSRAQLRDMSSVKEGLSLALPFYYIVSLLLFILGIISLSPTLAYFAFLLIYGPPVGMAIRTCVKRGETGSVVELFVLYSLYIAARIWSLVVSTWQR
jgi:glycosyltransferase involved in cell wall biosynthesis